MIDTKLQVQPWVLQLCHGYDGPFLDCARQYAVLFEDTPYRVCTIYLTGEPSDVVISGSASDEVIFLGLTNRDIRGLKLKAISAIRSVASSRDFRFCIAHRFKPTYVALLATNLPVIGIQHAFGVYSRKPRRVLANIFKKRLMLLGVSNAVRDDVRACLPSWRQERIQTLYNRINVRAVKEAQMPRKEARALLGVPQEAWIVGNVGRLHPDKDQSILIEGFAEALPALPTNSLLLIMGQGRLEKYLKTLVQKLGITSRVVFTGQVQHASRYFKAFDLFALSSVNEGFGMVLAEAMAAGVPIVSSNSKGACEIASGIGTVFATGDKHDLAKALVNSGCLSEKDIGLKIKAGYSKLMSEFSDESARANFHNQILSNILEKRS